MSKDSMVSGISLSIPSWDWEARLFNGLENFDEHKLREKRRLAESRSGTTKLGTVLHRHYLTQF